MCEVVREPTRAEAGARPLEALWLRVAAWSHRHEWALVALAAVLLFALRLPFLPPTLDDIDGYNFDRGVHAFDPVLHQPHPPGYPVFIFLAKLAHPLFAEHAPALAFLSALFGALLVFPLYGLLRELTSRAGAALATTLCLASPLVWFNSVRPMSDTTGLFFILVAQWLLVMALRRMERETGPASRARAIWYAGVLAAACAIGVRLQIVWLVGPVLLWGFARQRRIRFGTVAWFAAGLAAWAVPLVRESGGAAKYYESLRHLINTALPAEPLLSAPSLRRAVLSFWDVAGAPWGPAWLAVPVLVLAAIGIARLAAWHRSSLGWALLLFLPYALYHYLLQSTEAIRYALPVVPLLALAVSEAVVTPQGRYAMPRAVAPLAGAAFVALSTWWTVPALVAYHREPNPVAQAMDTVMRVAGSPDRVVLSGHPLFARHLAMMSGRFTVLPPDFRRAWMPMVRYWKHGGTRPILFLRNPRRSTLALVGRDGQTSLGTWSWPERVRPLMKGERPNSVELVRMDAPQWFAESGFFLTDEVGPPEEVARQEHRIYVRPSGKRRTLFATGTVRHAHAARVEMRKGNVLRREWQLAGDFALYHLMDPLHADGYVPVSFISPVPLLFNDIWVQDEDRAVVRPRSGFNGIEFDRTDRAFRWIGPQAAAEVYIPGDHARLRIRGSVPVKYFRLPVMLSLRWNDSPLRVFAVTTEQFSLECDLPAPVGDDDWGTLTVTSSHHFVPNEVQGNGDMRKLAARVYEMSIQ